jgi:hypothetical protein
VKFTAEYSWLESYLDNDSFWLEDVLSWDETFELALSDYNLFFFFTSAFFVNSHFFLDSITKMSFLDILFFSETDSYNASRELFDFIMWDHLSFISNNFFFSQFLFYTNYQDFISTVLHHSPELTLALSEFTNSYWLNYAMSYLPSASFDVFSDSFHSSISEFMDYMILFMVFVWAAIIFSHACRIMNWNNPLEIYLVRMFTWIFYMSRAYRQEFESALKTFFLVFFYMSMMLMTWDDDQEEMIEGFNDLLFNFFLSLFAYYTLKVSVHYLSFLEASISEGRNFAFVLTQFVRDMTNNFAFVLRYLTLIARLNIYDLNDDILDSYYIFLGDFDDDEYYMDMFFSLFSTMFFDTDNNDDRSFFLEDEVDFSADLFSLYFVIWGKFTLFNFFGLEEVARVGLALFITYLIVFEVHSLNRSYVEDTYLANKRFSYMSSIKKGMSNIL